MSEHLTDEQQAERVKQWWKENGFFIIVGATIGLAAIAGWQWWQKLQDQQAEAASEAYSYFLGQLNSDQAEQAFNTLKQKYDDNIYTDFARLYRAKTLLTSQQDETTTDTALVMLRQVADRNKDRGLAQVARLRLTRLYIGLQRLDEAQQVLDGVSENVFAAEVESLKGQIALHAGDIEAARAAFQNALEKGVADAALINMLLMNLPEKKSSTDKS